MPTLKGNIKEIQCYEEKEIEWEITDFPSIAEDEVIESPVFSFMDSTCFLRMLKPSQKTSGSATFGLYSTKPWKYSVKYDYSWRNQNGITSQLSKGILKGKESSGAFFFKLPEVFKLKSEVTSLNVFTIIITLQHGSAGIDQPSILSKPNEVQLFSRKLIKLDTLSDNFKDLLSNKESCDVTLHVQEKEYKAHRAVLIARSTVFAAMFLHDTLEKQTGIVNVLDCNPESFGEFLKFLYCGQLEEPSAITCLYLYEISDKYNVQELKKFCMEYLMGSLTVENLCDVATLADKYEESDLLNAAQDFFSKNLGAIFDTSEWDLLVKNNYQLSKKLLKVMSSKVKYVE